MKKKITILKKMILPQNIIFYLMVGLILLGVIAGSIFFFTINKVDSKLASDQVVNFFNNVNNNSLNNGLALKNSLIVNMTYIISLFILGLTIIGIPLIIFFMFFKGFILGFSLTTIISVYGYKGILGGLVYIFPHQLITVFGILLMCIYSISMSLKLIKLIFTKEKINMKNSFKKYFVILSIVIVLLIISSFLEAFLMPIILKLIIKLFI